VEPSTVDMSIGVMTERKLRFLNRHQAETHTTWSTLNSSVDAVSASHSPSAPMQVRHQHRVAGMCVSRSLSCHQRRTKAVNARGRTQ
jgi:hypothetical protein